MRHCKSAVRRSKGRGSLCSSATVKRHLACFTGAVRPDFGVDVSNALNNIYGPGALVGLPATITGRNYSMTATVTDDAELGFLSCQTVKSLLREQPEICQQLLKVLSAKIADTDRVVLRKRGVPETELGVA